MVIVVGYGEQSSNPGQSALYFTVLIALGKV